MNFLFQPLRSLRDHAALGPGFNITCSIDLHHTVTSTVNATASRAFLAS
jgi:hypothetical protein